MQLWADGLIQYDLYPGDEILIVEADLSVYDELRLSFHQRSSQLTHLNAARYAELLYDASKLTNLHISFCDEPSTRDEYGDIDETLLGYLSYGTAYPRLQHLTIEGITCDRDILIRLLTSHAATLRKLKLSNIQLRRGPNRLSGLCCLVVFLKDVRRVLVNLETFILHDSLSSYPHMWTLERRPPGPEHAFKDTILARVEHWMVDRSLDADDSPVEHLGMFTGNEIEGVDWSLRWGLRE